MKAVTFAPPAAEEKANRLGSYMQTPSNYTSVGEEQPEPCWKGHQTLPKLKKKNEITTKSPWGQKKRRDEENRQDPEGLKIRNN